MARVVLGIGTSHGPMLSTPPEEWGQRVEADRRNNELYFKGKRYSFDELVQLRREEHLERELGTEKFRARHSACQRALGELADLFASVCPDVAVIIGDDQEELFFEDNMPAFLVYWGERIDNVPPTPEQMARMPPGIAIAVPGHCPPEPESYPGQTELGLHLIQELMAQGFDVSHSRRLPPGRYQNHSIPHAYGFVYRQIMRDRVIPNVPVFINTFYPPNQPSLRRSLEFGRAIGRAIASWKQDAKVAVVASGGLSHFVVEEDLDQRVLGCLKEGDLEGLVRLPEGLFNSGTSEIRNWIALAGALEGSGLRMKLVDYVPCYRSLAGTGNAMGFAYWS